MFSANPDSFDSIGPAVQALPDFLKENQYKDFSDPTNTPLQKGWNTNLPAFLWVQTKPDLLNYFNQWMAAQRLGMPTWLDFYPYKEKTQGLDPSRPFFVDVGGGFGHQSVALRDKLPGLQNRIIVQDMAPVLEHAIKHPEVELMVHDFWQPQPIKGRLLGIIALARNCRLTGHRSKILLLTQHHT